MIFINLRKHTKTIMWVIAIFIVPAFVIWNIGSAVKNRRSGFAGKIFNQKVSWKDFAQEKQAVRNNIWMRFGEQQEHYNNLDEQTWTRLIMLEEAKKTKIQVTNKELLEYIKSLPLFKYANLAPENYALIIGRVFQQTPADFESGIKNSIMINKFFGKLTEDVIVSDIEVENAYRQEFEQASASYIVINPEDFKDAVQTDHEDDLKGFYENNKQKLMTQEQVNVKYIQIQLEKFKEEIQITQEQIENYYNKNKEEFKIAKEDNKENSAVEYKKFEQVSESIKDKLIEKEMINQASGLARTIMNKLYGDVSFDDVAKESGLTPKETGPFSMFDQVPDVGLSFPFIKSAFSLKPGEVSEIVKTPTAFYILTPIKKIAPYIPEYADIKDKVKDLYIQAKALEIAEQKAEQLRSELIILMQEEKIDFKKACADMGLDIKVAKSINRAGYVSELGFNKEFATAAFELKEAVSKSVKTTLGFCLISLDKIEPLDMEKFNEKKEEYAAKVLETKKADFLNTWFENIKIKANPQSFLEEEQS